MDVRTVIFSASVNMDLQLLRWTPEHERKIEESLYAIARGDLLKNFDQVVTMRSLEAELEQIIFGKNAETAIEPGTQTEAE